MLTFVCFAAWGGLVLVAVEALHREIESAPVASEKPRFTPAVK